MRRSEQREHIFKLLFMTQFNSEDEMSDQVSMYFETLGELEEKDQEAMQAKYQHILEVSKKVEDKVKSSIENMTGLEVADVNIRIAGVDMENDK